MANSDDRLLEGSFLQVIGKAVGRFGPKKQNWQSCLHQWRGEVVEVMKTGNEREGNRTWQEEERGGGGEAESGRDQSGF